MAKRDLRRASDRIEELLTELIDGGAPGVAARVDELVRLVAELYGEGLLRIMAALAQPDVTGAQVSEQLATDEEAEPFNQPVTAAEEPQSERGAPGSRPAAGEDEATAERVPDPLTEDHTAADQPGVDPKAAIDGEMEHLPPGDQGG
jgi:hypothetical protein